MFFNGLNPDIKVMFKYIPRSTIGIYVRACAFEKHIQEKTLDHSSAFSSCTLAPVVSSNVPRMNIVVRVAQPLTCDTSLRTSSKSDSQGKNKGTDFVSSHEIGECNVVLNMPCDDIENVLVTPPILEDCAINLMLCDQTTEIDDGLSAPIVDSNSCFHMSELVDIIDTQNGPCDIIFESNLDRIKLVHNDEVSAKVSQDNSL
jgi:hypothetical protein